MKQAQKRAETLVEALPYLQQFSDQTIVIKYGGSAMVETELKQSFATDITLLKQVGIKPIVVHGGGPQIGKMLKQLGKETKFVSGMRVTDQETMDIVEMVLAGLVNKEIVGNINRSGGRAVGLSGKDGQLISARKLHVNQTNPEVKVPEIIDLGHVGEVEKINPRILNALDKDRFISIIAPIGYDTKGQSYNINADLVAGAIAKAVGAAKLILLTDVAGVLGREKELCSKLTISDAESMLKDGTIDGGMIPKVKCCMDVVAHGVEKAHIINGKTPHALLLEILTDEGIGTVIY